MRTVGVITLLVLACAARGAGAAEHLHPSLKSRKVKFETVALVPVKVDFNRVAVTGVESQLQQAELLGSRLARAAAILLKERGITVVEDAFEELGEDQEGRYAVADLQSRYDRISSVMRKKPKDVRKGRYTLGDDVAAIASKVNAPAFLFIRANAVTQSGAARAMSVWTALFREQISYELAIVDGASGDVWFLAANPIMTVFGAGKRAESQNQIVMLMRRAIKKVPKASVTRS